MAAQDEPKQKKADKILADMKKKLVEIDDLREKLRSEKYTDFTPARSRAMLEEIVVPSLGVIKEEKKKSAI